MSDAKDPSIFILSTPTGNSFFYEMFMSQKRPVVVGVDWAKDSGMVRGDILSKEGNVVHVRFKTVGPEGLNHE
jgi:hypothetical protein